jgi:predicted nucleic acid-binding Zn ribbon protein
MPAARHCAECGKPITPSPKSSKQRKHCTPECRLAFTRRRRDRGAELYDFVMQNDQGTIAKLVHAYLQADLTKRAGRPSYLPVAVAVLALPLNYGTEGDKR